MEDTFTEVEHESWFERIKDAIVGVLFGLTLILVAIGGLFWNEGRAVQRARTLEEGRDAVQTIQADDKTAAEGKDLVHLTGDARTDDTVQDNQFGIRAENAVGLQRTVEMYQWKEHKSTETEDTAGGGTETETTYSYNKVWSDRHIDSSRFKKSGKYSNPSDMPYESATRYADTVTVGAFQLPPGLIKKIDKREDIPVNSDHVDGLPQDLKKEAKIHTGQFYLGGNPDEPSVGDLRVSFSKIPETTVSLVAKPVNGTFEPFSSEHGGEIFMLETGTHSANSLFTSAEEFNTMLTWILRLVGFVVMTIGFSLVFNPLAVVADIVPILGELIDMGISVVAGGCALILSLITIAIGWFTYRPIIALFLLLLVAVVIAGLVYLSRGNNSDERNYAQSS